ncbi:MAG: branched-chain amino acid ABC transporter permease [Acidimicrobiales bacterium]
MTEFLQLLVAGLAIGAQYALIVLGFVVIYKATGVINFAQGGMVLIGAYLTYNAAITWDLPFYVSIVVAMIGGALVGVLIEFLILRRMVGQPVFAVIMITIGLFIISQEVATSIWGASSQNLGDPWGQKAWHAGDVIIEVKDVATVVMAAIVLGAFFIVFRYTKIGIAMRATAVDQEAALAQGISARRVFAVSWGIAGAVAAVAGVSAAAGPATGLHPGLGAIALIAFPAMILGGLDSPGGAVVGGLIIGVTQSLAQGWRTGVLNFSWLPDYPELLGDGFDDVIPYLVMVLILMVRPFGLFGTREVRRV